VLSLKTAATVRRSPCSEILVEKCFPHGSEKKAREESAQERVTNQYKRQLRIIIDLF
jgi:hypothetical protein